MPVKRLLIDLIVLTAVASAAGLVSIVAHGVPLIAPPPEPAPTACIPEDEAGAFDVERLPRLGVEQLRSRLGQRGVTIVDARTPEDYEQAHIPGAVCLPVVDAERVLEIETVPIPPDDTVIVYCDGGSCGDAEYLGELLKSKVGCRDLHILEGGWPAWLNAGAPVEGQGLQSG